VGVCGQFHRALDSRVLLRVLPEFSPPAG
jgi:hypothetical protein